MHSRIVAIATGKGLVERRTERDPNTTHRPFLSTFKVSGQHLTGSWGETQPSPMSKRGRAPPLAAIIIFRCREILRFLGPSKTSSAFSDRSRLRTDSPLVSIYSLSSRVDGCVVLYGLGCIDTCIIL